MRLKIFKKADLEMRFIGVMILSVVILFVLTVFYKNMVDTSKSIAETEVCRRSVELSSIKLKAQPAGVVGTLQSAYKDLMDPFGNPTRLDCSTKYINVRSKEPEVIKKRIADEMADCWYLYGNGQKELFDTTDNNYCVVCSRLTFDQEVEVDEFIPFLRTQKVPVKYQEVAQDLLEQKRDKTYWRYLMGIEMENFLPDYYYNSDLSKYDTFRTDFPLAVMYIMEKDAYPDGYAEEGKTAEAVEMGVLGTIGGVIAGVALCATGVGCGAVALISTVAWTGTVGGALGSGAGYLIGSDRSADWNARVMLWNYDELKELPCTYIEAKSVPLEVVQK